MANKSTKAHQKLAVLLDRQTAILYQMDLDLADLRCIEASLEEGRKGLVTLKYQMVMAMQDLA